MGDVQQKIFKVSLCVHMRMYVYVHVHIHSCSCVYVEVRDQHQVLLLNRQPSSSFGERVSHFGARTHLLGYSG